MTKYTPGPWTANGDQVEVETDKNDGYRVCDVFGPDYRANARLIAAAPDLLAALKVAKEIVDMAESLTASRSDDDYIWSAQTIINAAISKAEGGET